MTMVGRLGLARLVLTYRPWTGRRQASWDCGIKGDASTHGIESKERNRRGRAGRGMKRQRALAGEGQGGVLECEVIRLLEKAPQAGRAAAGS